MQYTIPSAPNALKVFRPKKQLQKVFEAVGNDRNTSYIMIYIYIYRERDIDVYAVP